MQGEKNADNWKRKKKVPMLDSGSYRCLELLMIEMMYLGFGAGEEGKGGQQCFYFIVEASYAFLFSFGNQGKMT